MEHSGAWLTLIYEKNLKLKILFQTPFKLIGNRIKTKMLRGLCKDMKLCL